MDQIRSGPLSPPPERRHDRRIDDRGRTATPATNAQQWDVATIHALSGLVGNHTVAQSIALQRGSTNISGAPPSSSQAPPQADPEVMVFEGKRLRFDRAVLVKVLGDIEFAQGVDARASFVGRFKNPGAHSVQNLTGLERPGLFQDLITGLDEASSQLDHEHSEFCKKFEVTAGDAAREILTNSEQTLSKELARLGIKMTGATAGIPGEVGGATFWSPASPPTGAALRSAATELLPLAQQVDVNAKASAKALSDYEAASVPDPFGLSTKPLFVEWEARRNRWSETNTEFDNQRRVKVAAQPSIALYLEEPNRVSRLTTLSTMTDQQLGSAMADEITGRLDNIKKVRPHIGDDFSVWKQSHLRRVTLDQMKATQLEREVVERNSRAVQSKSDNDAMLFGLLGLGLGLLSAIPTGGGSLLLAGVGAAAAAAGAGLSLYSLGTEWNQFTLAAAAGATDIEKANAISHDDPDNMALALAILGAVSDVFGAAEAFKTLRGVFKAARGGDVGAALNVARITDNVGIGGSARQKIVGDAVANLSEKEIEDVARTAARGGSSFDEGLATMAGGVGGRHNQFTEQLKKAMTLLDHVQGRIPDAARDLVATGKVRVFDEASLMEVFGELKGKEKWKTLAYADGFYSPAKDIMFVRPGKLDEDLVGTLIHEATHRVGKSNPLRGNNFMSEAVAEFAERDFYVSLYHESGPLWGTPIRSNRIRDFLTMTDEQLMVNIEHRYFDAKKEMDAAKRMHFLNVADVKPDDVVRQVFADIAADYQARLPRVP